MSTNKKHLNVIITNSPVDSANMGCVALTYSFTYLLDRILKSEGIPYNLYITGYYKKLSERKLIFKDCEVRFKTITSPITFGFKGKLVQILRFNLYRKSKSIYRNADIIFNIGEGDSFADIYGKHRFELISKAIKSALKYNVPHCFLPQTIGPFKDSEIADKAKEYMDSAKMVMVRDKTSFELVKHMSPDINVKEYVDLAFMLPFNKYMFDPSKIHVGINVSSLLWNGGYDGTNQFDLKANYKVLVQQLISSFLEEAPNIQIHLISHVFMLDKENVENDFGVMTDIYKELNNSRVTLAPLSFNPIDVKSYIAGMDFFTGSRMHATIAAFSTNVPVVPLAYSRKFSGLFVETLKYPYVSDLKTMSEEEVVESIIVGFRDRIKLKQMIQNSLSSIVQKRLNVLEQDLKSLILKISK